MPRGKTVKTPENLAMVQRLRGEGWRYKEIAERMGVPIPTVAVWLQDPDGLKSRARKRRYGGTCVDCGGRTDGSAGVGKGSKRCHKCAAVYQHESRRWTRERIVEALQKFAREHGRQPVATDLVDGLDLRSTARREFGSWASAVRAAGFEPKSTGSRGPGGVSREERAEIIRLYESGLSGREVGERFGVTASDIAHKLNRWGVKTRHCEITAEDRARFERAYREAGTVKAAAERCGLNYHTAVSRVRRWGL